MQSIRRARGVAAADGAGLQRPTAARAAPAPRGTNYQVTKLRGIEEFLTTLRLGSGNPHGPSLSVTGNKVECQT